MAQGAVTLKVSPHELDTIHAALRVYRARLCNILLTDQGKATLPEPDIDNPRTAALDAQDLLQSIFGSPKRPNDDLVTQALGLQTT